MNPHPAMFPRSTALGAAVVAASLLITACSGDGGTPTEPSSVAPPPSAPPASPALVVHDSLQPAGDTTTVDWSASNSSAAAMYYQALDDFESPSSTTIRTVSWQGVYCASAYNPPLVALRTATGFELAFYADINGGPLIYPNQVPDVPVPLYTATFTLPQVNETLDVNTSAVCSNSDQPSPTGLYHYTVTLPTPFDVKGGTRYWLRVQAHTISFGHIWGWRHGKTGNGMGAITISGNLHRLLRDFAFSLR